MKDSVIKLQAEVELMKPQLKECLATSKVLTELKVITQHQVEHSKKMDVVIEEQSKTLVRQGEVLVAVHEQMKKNNEDIDEVKTEINAIKQGSSIMTSEIVRYVMFGGLGALVSYIGTKIL